VATPKKLQNGWLYAPAATKKKDGSTKCLPYTQTTLTQSLMVSVCVSMLGCTGLIFVKLVVKMTKLVVVTCCFCPSSVHWRPSVSTGVHPVSTGVHQCQCLLASIQCPLASISVHWRPSSVRWRTSVSADHQASGELLVFQWGRAPAHRAHKVLGLLEQGTAAFNPPGLCPRLDLSLVDYRIWRAVQECIYQTKLWDISDLRQHLTDVWVSMQQSLIDGAIAVTCCVTTPEARSSELIVLNF